MYLCKCTHVHIWGEKRIASDVNSASARKPLSLLPTTEITGVCQHVQLKKIRKFIIVCVTT